jgi:hypothetical protein
MCHVLVAHLNGSVLTGKGWGVRGAKVAAP